MKKRFLHILGPLLTIVVLSLALYVLHNLLRNYHYRDVVAYLRSLPRSQVALALGFTFFSYLVLTLYDTLGVRTIGHPLPYHRIALASFIGYAFNNNIGFAGLAGNSLRYRIYTTWGLSAVEVAKVIGFCVMTFWMGFLAVAGTAFLVDPVPLPVGIKFSFSTLRPLGAVLLIPVVCYLGWNAIRKKPIRLGNWVLIPPPLRVSFAQIGLAALDWAAAASVFYTLLPQAGLPQTGHVSFPQMLGLFLLAQIAGLLSHVPGGLGIFETIMLWSLTPPHSVLEHPFTQPQVLGALVAFRGIYYLLPLGCAVVALGAHEITIRAERLEPLLERLGRWMPPFVFQRLAAHLGRKAPITVSRETVRLIGQWAPALVPNVFAFAVFVAGALLLFSGATPGVHERLTFLNAYLPERLMEVAHLLASMVGAALLLLARGLQRRLDSAYLVTVILLAIGIPFSLVKGFDYEEASVLLLILLAFIPCRPHFYRKASLLSRYSISPGWATAIALTIAGSIWLGMFSYKRVQYSPHLWVHFGFSLRGDASKFMRASIGAIGVVVLYGLKVLLRPAPPESIELSEEDWQTVRDIVETSPRTYSWSALLRDKKILLNSKRNAFIMYGIEGRSWVALGDPIGPEEEKDELAWQFRELSDAHGGWTVFYHALPDHLPLYLDLGLVLLKLGEEAMVPLETFSIEGKAHKTLRQGHHKVAREGYQFQIVPAGEVAPLLPELRAISDAWLAAKHTREKGFSLGFFSEAYLQELPMALVRDAQGRLIAFANIWPGAGREELSVDMMRYTPELHQGIMDYLFVELMLWGRQQGYKWFNLGMAPLSGLESRSLAPLWVRIGAIIFRHGEHFYNFQGLRHYKEKFNPVWVPKYVAAPGGIVLPRVLTNIAALISRGLKGVVSK